MKVAPGDTIALIGLMGSGKSEVGALLARLSRRPFIDIDVEIQAATGMSIAEIFERSGEEGFREIEQKLIQESAMQKGAVIACGGGAVESEASMSALAKSGVIVYLSVDPATAARRVGAGEGRPLLQGVDIEDKLNALSKARSNRYERFANVIVDAAGLPEQVAGDIVRELGL